MTSGERTIGVADTVVGPVVHFGGSLMIEGHVRGDVTAVGSEVTLRPGAVIEGNLTVVGGALYATTMAEIGGTRNWLRGEKVTVTESPGRLFVDYEPPPSPGFPIELKGIAGVVIHTYNGVDGLLFGLEAGLKERREGPRTELEGGPVFHSERDDVGWRVAGLRDLPAVGGITIGGAAYRVTSTPEAWHRGERGNGLARSSSRTTTVRTTSARGTSSGSKRCFHWPRSRCAGRGGTTTSNRSRAWSPSPVRR